jgi:hypothetical protein
VDVEDGMPDQFFLTSPHLSDLTDPQAVIDRGLALKALFDGALHIERRNYYPLRLKELRVKNSAPFPLHLSNVLAHPFSDEYIQTRLAGEFNPLGSFLAQSIFMARYDDATRLLLSFLGMNGVTWISLYGAKDLLPDYGWTDKQIAAKGLASKKVLQLFDHTANTPQVLGPIGRHGRSKNAPPPKPMTLDEAKNLLLPIFKAFLENRAVEIGLKEKWKAIRAPKKAKKVSGPPMTDPA